MESAENQCLIDSSVLIGLLDEEDLFSKKSLEEFEKMRKNNTQAIISDYVLQETFTVLLYKNKGDRIPSALDLLRNEPKITLVDINLKMLIDTVAFAKKQSFQPKLSLTDWSLAYLSSVTKTPIITFDKQLKNCCKKFT